MQEKQSENVELEDAINGIAEGLKNFNENNFCNFQDFTIEQAKKYGLKI